VSDTFFHRAPKLIMTVMHVPLQLPITGTGPPTFWRLYIAAAFWPLPSTSTALAALCFKRVPLSISTLLFSYTKGATPPG
jgi:hypothetical protein